MPFQLFSKRDENLHLLRKGCAEVHGAAFSLRRLETLEMTLVAAQTRASSPKEIVQSVESLLGKYEKGRSLGLTGQSVWPVASQQESVGKAKRANNN